MLPDLTLIIFPKKEIKNLFGQVIYKYGEGYECRLLTLSSSGYPFESEIKDPHYVVKCELIGNEYPILGIDEIHKSFYINEEWRDSRLEILLK